MSPFVWLSLIQPNRSPTTWKWDVNNCWGLKTWVWSFVNRVLRVLAWTSRTGLSNGVILIIRKKDFLGGLLSFERSWEVFSKFIFEIWIFFLNLKKLRWFNAHKNKTFEINFKIFLLSKSKNYVFENFLVIN